MKRCGKISYFLYVCMGLMLASCQSNQKDNSASSTDETNEKTTEAQAELQSEALPKVKSDVFYQQMLDVFCRQHYDALFKDIMGTRKYVAGSLKVDSVSSLEGNKVLVYGKHDFEGRFGKEHEDRSFVACVQENNDKPNEYVVTFAKEKKGLTSIAGKSDSETRTQTFYYDANEGGIQISEDINKLKNNDYYERFLDKFCQQNYDELFKDLMGKRKYVAGSLKVDSVQTVNDREVKVFGKHDFEGRTGKDHSDRNFEANILETKDKPNEYIVSFKKEGKTLIGKKYSESRSKTYVYEE